MYISILIIIFHRVTNIRVSTCDTLNTKHAVSSVARLSRPVDLSKIVRCRRRSRSQEKQIFAESIAILREFIGPKGEHAQLVNRRLWESLEPITEISLRSDFPINLPIPRLHFHRAVPSYSISPECPIPASSVVVQKRVASSRRLSGTMTLNRHATSFVLCRAFHSDSISSAYLAKRERFLLRFTESAPLCELR